MCYKKPGPRCSKHALARIQAISDQAKDSGWTRDLNSKLHEAMTEFYTTPAGIEHLRENDNEDMADNYAKIRKQRITLCKKMHDKDGDSIYYQGDPNNLEGTHPEHLYVSAATRLDRTHEIEFDPVENTLY